MRRRLQPRARPLSSNRELTLDIRSHFDAEQLRNYAACCLTWNRIENAINASTAICIGADAFMRLEITSRINGIDGKLALIYAGMEKVLRINANVRTIITESIGSAAGLKRYRDGIAHAFIYDATDAAALTSPRKGMIDETLIDKGALDALYQHLNAGYLEIRDATSILLMIAKARKRKLDDSAGSVKGIRDGIAQLQEHQSRRKSLPPLPKFPE